MTAERGARASRRELLSFALTVGGALLVLGAFLYSRGRVTATAVVAGLGAALVAGGLIAPARLGPLYRGWMTLALAISKVTTPLFMGIVYFGVVTPIALGLRLFGRRPLARPRGARSYWVDRQPSSRRSDLRRQF